MNKTVRKTIFLFDINIFPRDNIIFIIRIRIITSPFAKNLKSNKSIPENFFQNDVVRIQSKAFVIVRLLLKINYFYLLCT